MSITECCRSAARASRRAASSARRAAALDESGSGASPRRSARACVISRNLRVERGSDLNVEGGLRRNAEATAGFHAAQAALWGA